MDRPQSTIKKHAMPLPSTIISGGQTGADRAGLDFALANSLVAGGWCPHGRIAEDGPIPKKYPLKETPASDYSTRTKWNVRDSFATVIFNRGYTLSPGCALTLRYCGGMNRPYLLLQTPESAKEITPAYVDQQGSDIARFLASYEPMILNIAGNRERKSPGIHQLVTNLLGSAWEQYAAAKKTVAPAPMQDDFLLGVFATMPRASSAKRSALSA
jgi:hypothetical protein